MNGFVLRPGGRLAAAGKGSHSWYVRATKTGRIMPRAHLTPAELQELHDLAARWGEIIARRTGDDAIEFDLSALEGIAQAAAASARSKAPAMLAATAGRRPGGPAALPSLSADSAIT